MAALPPHANIVRYFHAWLETVRPNNNTVTAISAATCPNNNTVTATPAATTVTSKISLVNQVIPATNKSAQVPTSSLIECTKCLKIVVYVCFNF